MRLCTALLGLSLFTLPLGDAWAAGGAGTESAGGGASLSLAMTLYAGGLSLGKVDMDAKFTGDKYHIVSNLETSGVVNVFWQSQIQATSSGRLDKKVMQPQSYDSFYTGHNANHQEVALTFENGEPVRLADVADVEDEAAILARDVDKLAGVLGHLLRRPGVH